MKTGKMVIARAAPVVYHDSIHQCTLPPAARPGGGGMNKINLPEEKLARYHNPKYPQDYIQRIDTILRQKDEIFALLEEQNV